MKIKSVLIQLIFVAALLLPIHSLSAYNRLIGDRKITLQEEYRVTGYRKSFNGWEKVPLRIRVTPPSYYSGKEKIEVVAYQTSLGWQTVSKFDACFVAEVRELLDGKEIAANFEYKASCAGTVYFNF